MTTDCLVFDFPPFVSSSPSSRLLNKHSSLFPRDNREAEEEWEEEEEEDARDDEEEEEEEREESSDSDSKSMAVTIYHAS